MAAGFVGYGSAGVTRTVKQLRLVLVEVQVATVRNQVMLSLYTALESFSAFKRVPHQEGTVNSLLDQGIAWGGALKTLRAAGGARLSRALGGSSGWPGACRTRAAEERSGRSWTSLMRFARCSPCGDTRIARCPTRCCAVSWRPAG